MCVFVCECACVARDNDNVEVQYAHNRHVEIVTIYNRWKLKKNKQEVKRDTAQVIPT